MASSSSGGAAGVGAGPSRRYRATLRTRLALTYSALLTGAGLVMLAIVYVFMRFVPTYEFAGVPALPSVPAPPELPPISLPPGSELGEPAIVSTPASEILITSSEQLLNLLLVTSAVVLLALAIVGIAVGWAVAGRMLRPLQFINTAVHQAAQGDLGHRIGLVGPRDELSELAENFDNMLAQLEQAFAASRRFASNASHELLTPLATSRAMLDLAIEQRARGVEQSPEAELALFERLRTMNERSIETAGALLQLAQIDATARHPERVDLARLASDAADSLAEEAAARGVRVTVDVAPAFADVEPVLARQLVTNLVQNAIRHNVSAGFVTITTRAGAGNAGAAGGDAGAVLTVENSGELVDAATLESLTEPFVRAGGRAAASSASGHGLGLSIVSAIAERFRARLHLAARPEGGLLVRVTFPVCEP